MSLRLRIIISLMLFTLLLLAGYLSWWFPGYTPRIKKEFLALGHAELALLSGTILPERLAGNPVNLAKALDSARAKSPPWNRVRLTDASGKRLYPRTLPPADTASLTWLSTPITHGGKELATLRVGADLQTFTVGKNRQAFLFGLLLLAIPLFLMLALLLFTERWVTRPVSRLAFAAREIANGELPPSMPPETGDEVGQLTKAFGIMQTRLNLREKRRNENEARLCAIIDNSVEALVTIDSTGTLRSFNKAAERIFGYTAEEVTGDNIRILMPMPYRAEHDNYIRHYLRTGVRKVIGMGREVKGKRKSGEIFPIWIAVSEVKINAERLFVGSIMDITQQKLADAELSKHRDNLRNMIHDRTKDLKIAMEKAEAANRAKSNFISNMSHEIRTPMNAMLGFLSLALENPELPDDLRNNLEVAHRSSWSLLGLLDDILDISKLEGGRIKLDKTSFNLARLLREITSTMEVAAREKGLSLNLYVGTPFPAYCSGDPMRLRQVLFNLLSNAVKFTHRGGVEVHALPLEYDEIHFFIKDTGIGIPEDRLSQIFTPFSQADDSSTRRYGGTGLGTSISKQLVELMGGSIWVESEADKGSTFHFTLTLAETEAEAECDPPPLPQPERPSLPSEGLSILVAEDISENAKLIMIRLKQQGHKATAAINGKEVFQALANDSFELILMDVHMPEMDGLEATRGIRNGQAGEACRRIPIIGLTASAGQQDVKECLDAGMNDVVTKPIDFEHLYATMRATLPHDDLDAAPKPEPPQEESWPPIEGVNVEQAMKTWQQKATYFRALATFVDKFTAAPEAMLQAVDEGRTETLQEQVHAIKGASANLQMIDVHMACEALTPLLSTENTEAMRSLILSMASAFRRLSESLAEQTEEAPPPPAPLTAAPAEQVNLWFKGLLDALSSDNPDQVEPLLSTDTAYIPVSRIAEIQNKISIFDFRGAEEDTRKAAIEMGINLHGDGNGET